MPTMGVTGVERDIPPDRKFTIFDLSGGFFNEQEKWGDWKKLSGFLLMLLFHLRRIVGYPFTIHCAWDEDGHTDKSQHYHGRAVDFHIKGLSHREALRRIEEALALLLVEDRVGLGAYLDWNSPGFHLDVRGTRARWGRLKHTYVSWDLITAEIRKEPNE